MSEEAQQFVVTVAAERCQGHNRCCMIAPELFESDDLGFTQVIGDGVVTDALLPKAKLAVANCPEYAIRINRKS